MQIPATVFQMYLFNILCSTTTVFYVSGYLTLFYVKVCQGMFEPFSEIYDNISTIYCTDIIQILSEKYKCHN